MAYTAKKQNTTTSVQNLPRADAFLNIAVLDKKGIEHRLPRGIALTSEQSKLMRSLVNLGDGTYVTVTATVNHVTEDDGKDFDFS